MPFRARRARLLNAMRRESQNVPLFMKPAIFIGSSVLIGLLFAFQEWLSVRHMGYDPHTTMLFESWGYQFLVWGTLCWLLWRFLNQQVQRASILAMFSAFLPLSIVISLGLQMLYVLIFRNLPPDQPEPSFWKRFSIYAYAELLNNVLIFWCAFFLFRGIGYYQRYREQQEAKSELEIQLANAQLAALRMQLNPHFLFNAMNSISSLMRSDVDSADNMLEQLSCLMRMSLERGDSQLITLREEMEFIEVYLAMQGRRYAGRVRQSVRMDPELYDALVPSMLLQPIVENAYVHGISKTEASGVLAVESRRIGNQMRLTVMNSGVGLNSKPSKNSSGHGVGLRNIQRRLNLHYGAASSFGIAELDSGHVQVDIVLPLHFESKPILITRFGTR